MLRRAALVVALVALPVAVAACGGGKKSASTTTTTSATSAKETVQVAAKKTAAAGTMRIAVRAGTATASETVVVAGTGAFDTPNHKGELHLHFTAGPISSTMDVVLDGSDIYLRSPLFSILLPTGKSWIKLDAKTAGKVGGVDLSSLLSQDPSAALDAIANSTTSVTEVGIAHGPGAGATVYRAHAKASTGSSAAVGVYTVWVGSDGYIHRIRTNAAATSGSKSAHIVATSTLSGFGDTVDVTVPPASQTVTSTNGSIPGLGG
jgi:hypothetical protein